MPRHSLPASDAARQLGISLDTLRRWDRQGRIRTERDRRNRRLVPASEIDRLRQIVDEQGEGVFSQTWPKKPN